MNYALSPRLAQQINATNFGPAGITTLPEHVAVAVDHLPDCYVSRLYLVARNRDSALVLRCSTCCRYLVLRGGWLFAVLRALELQFGPGDVLEVPDVRGHAVIPQTPAATPSRPAPMVSRYFCRDHPDQPTDHRGRGCPECR